MLGEVFAKRTLLLGQRGEREEGVFIKNRRGKRRGFRGCVERQMSGPGAAKNAVSERGWVVREWTDDEKGRPRFFSRPERGGEREETELPKASEGGREGETERQFYLQPMGIAEEMIG